MAAKTAAHDEQRKDGAIVAYKMKGSEKIFKGSTVFKGSDGYAFTNDGTTNTLSNGDVYLGIAVETIDNTGSNGDIDVRVYRTGTVVVDTVDTMSIADIGAKMLINNVSDDAKVTDTSDTGNPEVEVGEVVEFISANQVRIAIDNFVGNVVAAAA